MEIIQKPIFRHFLLFFNVFLLIFGISAQNSTICGQQAAGVPIIMILSQDDPGLYTKANPVEDPMYKTFLQALGAHVTTLISPPVLYWLIKRANEQRDSHDWASKLQNDYAFFLTKDEGFALIVPKEQKGNLAALGINADYLSEPLTTASSIKERLSNPKFKHQDIRPEQIGQLFIKNSYFHHVPPKYWYITGHGLDSIDDATFEWSNASIAEMPVYVLVNLLEILDKINSRSAYLLSCYCSGSNALKIQNILSGTVTDERCSSISQLDFPVIFQCCTDIVACPIIENFPQFFAAMQEWDNEDASSCDCLAQKMNDQFMKATPKIKRFANYPIVRMPKTCAFQAVPFPSTIVISEPIATAQTIEAPADKEMIQISPADLTQLTIHMSDGQLPCIISRVQGRSHHFIGSITTQAQGTIAEIINASFLNGIIRADEKDFFCGVSDKAWFIETLTIADKETIHGLAVFKGSLKHATHQAIAVYRASKDQYFRLTMALPTFTQNNDITKEEIDESTYVQTLQEIYWQTLPNQDALDEATHKSESQTDHNALFIEFGKKLGIPLSVPADDEMIKKDFNLIKSGRINKDKYINYAAHIHYKPLIDAIVEHGMNGDIFDTHDIILLLFKLIDHEYQSLIFKQVKKLAERDDRQILYCVENAFMHCLDVGLYKHALQMYDDLFICLKKALSHKELKNGLIADIQEDLTRFVVMLVHNDCAQNGVEKVLELLNSSDLGLQVIGLILFTTMENAGYTNDNLNQKRSLLHAIALNLKRAVQSHNAIALYFYEQALVQQCIACLTTRNE